MEDLEDIQSRHIPRRPALQGLLCPSSEDGIRSSGAEKRRVVVFEGSPTRRTKSGWRVLPSPEPAEGPSPLPSPTLGFAVKFQRGGDPGVGEVACGGEGRGGGEERVSEQRPQRLETGKLECFPPERLSPSAPHPPPPPTTEGSRR